jgi:tRNA dimethylallyltransferase
VAGEIICLMGPTASGKTDLAIALAEQLDCELISVDSALVYRGLDIGSAKPDYPHHLVDIRDPAEAYSAAEFVDDALALCEAITARGKTPLLVGGTMLYFKALLEGMANMPPGDAAIRAKIERMAATRGWPHVHQELARVDPESAERIHPNHSQRLGRALEVYLASGIPMSQWHARQDPASPLARFTVHQLAICPAERKVLHQRIARHRVFWRKSGACTGAETCTRPCPPFAPWVTASCGSTSMGRSAWPKRWKRALPPPANWPSVSSPGCANGPILSG